MNRTKLVSTGLKKWKFNVLFTPSMRLRIACRWRSII